MIEKRKTKNGVSLVELCFGLVIAIPVFLAAFDCAMLAIGMQINEKTCREAARTAATGEPSSANSRANFVISQAQENKSHPIADITLVSVVNSIKNTDINTAKTYGGTVSGAVTVTTAADIESLLVHWFSPKQRYLTIQCQQTFPYTYVFPAPQESTK
jgi:hypothetical protein